MAKIKLQKVAATLTKAIAYAENGGAPNLANPVAGKSGEMASIFQYTPDTWKAVAAKYLGDANAPLNIENETKATYLRVEGWLKAGKSPAQIASMWNAGEGEPDAYTGKWGTTNATHKAGDSSRGSYMYEGRRIYYDVPEYASKVQRYAMQLWVPDVSTHTQEAPVEEEKKNNTQEAPVEEEKKNNWFQNLISAPVTLMTRIWQLGAVVVAKLSGDKQLQENVYKVIAEPYEFPMGLGTVPAQKAFGEGGGKQITGLALETAAWLYPGAKPIAPTYVKALNWFGRGFAFGSGDALQDGKTTTEAIADGTFSGTFSLALGIVATSLSKFGVGQLTNENSMLNKVRNWVVKEVEKGGRDGIIKNVNEINQPLYKNVLKTVKSTVQKEFKDIVSAKGLSGILGTLAVFKPTRSGALTGLSLRAVYTFLSTAAGKNLIYQTLKRGASVLSKIDAPMRNRVAETFISWQLSELVNELNDALMNKPSTIETGETKL